MHGAEGDTAKPHRAHLERLRGDSGTRERGTNGFAGELAATQHRPDRDGENDGGAGEQRRVKHPPPAAALGRRGSGHSRAYSKTGLRLAMNASTASR